jgi:AcrR family transcriptional regulator
MGEKKIDRRVRKTKRQLQSGLIQLLQAKSIQKITVRELSDLVDINRGTFYLHYKDVFDMLDQIENKLAEDFLMILSHYPSLHEKNNVYPLLVEVFSFIALNEGMMRVVFCENRSPFFLNYLKSCVKERYFNDWKRMHRIKAPDEIEYFFSYFISGCIGLITHWLETGMKETPEELAKLTERMILDGNEFS